MAAAWSPVPSVAWKAGPGPWTIAAIWAVRRLATSKGWNSSVEGGGHMDLERSCHVPSQHPHPQRTLSTKDDSMEWFNYWQYLL